jgi:hypothetical protein
MKYIKYFFYTVILLTALHAAYAQSSTADSLRQQLKSTKKFNEKFKLLKQLNAEYLQRGYTDSMGRVGKDMLYMARQANNDTLVIQSYVTIGNYLAGKADFEASLEFYFKALHLAEELKHTEMLILLNNNIGGEYEDLKNFNEAIKYTRKVRQLLAEEAAEQAHAEENATSTAIKRKRNLMQVFNNWHMAYDYLNLDKPDSALKYVQLAENIIGTQKLTGMQLNFIHAHINWTYGQIYEQFNKPGAASRYQHAINFSDSLKLNTPYVLALNSYSYFLYKNKRYEEARSSALTALHEAQKINFSLEVINSAASLSKIYTAMQMPDSANYYYQLKDTYQDKIFNQQRISRLQDITFTEQIHQAEEQARQAESEEQRKHNLQYAAIAIAIITFVVIFLLLSRSTKVSPRLIEFLGVVGLLILFEFINLLLHPFIGEYTHHSPLLMLIIMVFIAALLVPMHHKIEHWMKHKFISH